jgi:hypothetical protein
MVERKKWEEFRNTGLVVIINQILHAFGWAIVFEVENDQIKDVYPARVKFRGFSNDRTDKAYKKIGKYLKDNIEDLYNESNQ